MGHAQWQSQSVIGGDFEQHNNGGQSWRRNLNRYAHVVVNIHTQPEANKKLEIDTPSVIPQLELTVHPNKTYSTSQTDYSVYNYYCDNVLLHVMGSL